MKNNIVFAENVEIDEAEKKTARHLVKKGANYIEYGICCDGHTIEGYEALLENGEAVIKTDRQLSGSQWKFFPTDWLAYVEGTLGEILVHGIEEARRKKQSLNVYKKRD